MNTGEIHPGISAIGTGPSKADRTAEQAALESGNPGFKLPPDPLSSMQMEW